jgi:chromosomal replication initiation ATPase DnaA
MGGRTNDRAAPARLAFRRLAGRDPAAARVVRLVAQTSDVPVELILDRVRPASVSRARQLAMYLMHVVLRRTMDEAARPFGRDRTTATHACARIEEWREDPAFDAEVDRLESAIAGNGPEARHAAG